MHTLSAKPLAGSSCKTSSRRCFTSSASAISIRRKPVHGAQRRDLPRYRLAATPDGQNAGDVNEGVARLERWGDKLEEFGSADTSNFNLNIPTATGERGPSEAVVFEGGAGPAEDRSHTEPHKLQDKASDFTAASSSSSTITAGRDTSDMQNAPVGASSSSSKARDAESEESEDATTARVHPVARTAGTAAASAAGTIIGAAAGPVGAAAGAAIGAAIGRRAADILGGTEEQGEVYDAGAEPEQVAEEVASAGEAVSHKARDAADTLQAKANELVDRASERLDRGGGGSSDRVQGSDQDTGLADLTLISGELDLTEDTDDDLTSRSTRSSSDRARSGSSKVSDLARSAADRVAGAAESLKETAVGAAHTAADKIGDAADQIPLPEFPPSSDRDQGDFHSAGGGVRLEDDRTLQGAKNRVSGAAESARDKLGSAAEEAKDRARSAAAAAKERLGGAGDRAADSAADYEVTEGLQATSIPDLDGVPAEDIVKADVGTPIDQGQVSSVIQSDNMSLTDEISSTSGGSGSSEAEKLAAFVDQRGDESEQGLGNAPQREV